MREVVDDEDLERDVRVPGGDTRGHLTEEPVAARQHVVLGAAGDLPRAAARPPPARQLAGEANPPPGARLRDHLERETPRPHLRDRTSEHGALERRWQRGDLALDAD